MPPRTKNASGADDAAEEREQGDERLKQQAAAFGMRHLSTPPKNISQKELRLIPEEVARKQHAAIIARRDNTLIAIVVDPQNIDALNVLRFVAEKEKCALEINLVSSEMFSDIIQNYSSAEKAVAEAMRSLETEEEELESAGSKKSGAGTHKERESIQDAPVAKLAHVVIKHALDGRASDIHIEPLGNNYRIRFRVDGILHSSLTLPLDVGRAVVSRIKILANLKIDEKRKPQDGRFRVEEEGRDVDFRVSTLPVVEGEKVVMRVLEKDRETFDFNSLGLMGNNLKIFLRHIRDPYGMLLLTGPTGSGKSTTLYAFLKELNKDERNIITLEDPVEYFIPGINQSQVKPEIGYTFANGLRSILRQDPNVIMVGEIRDSETAELVIHAALTGHLVFSTVHTNNALGAIPRLIDMGIEPFLLASSLRVVAAQRLVRRICENCKEPMKIPPAMEKNIRVLMDNIPSEEMQQYGIEHVKEFTFYRGRGCEECAGLGLKGRIAIYEVLEVDEIVQQIVEEQEGSETALEKEAQRRKMMTMKQDGILKAMLGLTTLSEVERVTEGSLSIGGKTDEIAEGEELARAMERDANEKIVYNKND